MADKLDKLLTAAAERADASVDYAAMHAAILKKAQMKKRALRTNIIRYGSVAAALVLLLGAGTLALLNSGYGKMNNTGDFAFLAEAPQMGEKSAEDARGEGAVLEAAPTDALTSGSGAAPTGENEELLDPASLPGCCDEGADTLFWIERAVTLPGVPFGVDTSVESDDTSYLCVVADCLIEDFDYYVASVEEMYPDIAFTRDTEATCDMKNVFTGLIYDEFFLTVTFAEGEVRIQLSINN